MNLEKMLKIISEKIGERHGSREPLDFYEKTFFMTFDEFYFFRNDFCRNNYKQEAQLAGGGVGGDFHTP